MDCDGERVAGVLDGALDGDQALEAGYDALEAGSPAPRNGGSVRRVWYSRVSLAGQMKLVHDDQSFEDLVERWDSAQAGAEKRWVSFARTSDRTLAGLASLRMQEDLNRATAASRGSAAAPVAELREAGSTAAADRPVMDWAWLIVEGGAVDAVCMDSMDRAYRDMSQMLRFVRHCNTHGVELWISRMEDGLRFGPARRVAAGLVRRIYEMALEGKSIGEIAETLNESEGLR